MSQESAPPESLADFLLELRAGRCPAEPLTCGRAKAAFNTAACTPAQAAELERLANRPLPGLTLYKFGSRSMVGNYTLADGQRVVFKYYFPSGTIKSLNYGMRGSRCHRRWLAGMAINVIGVPTPAPLVIAELHRRGGIWLSKSFLATRPAAALFRDVFDSP